MGPPHGPRCESEHSRVSGGREASWQARATWTHAIALAYSGCCFEHTGLQYGCRMVAVCVVGGYHRAERVGAERRAAQPQVCKVREAAGQLEQRELCGRVCREALHLQRRLRVSTQRTAARIHLLPLPPFPPSPSPSTSTLVCTCSNRSGAPPRVTAPSRCASSDARGGGGTARPAFGGGGGGGGGATLVGDVAMRRRHRRPRARRSTSSSGSAAAVAVSRSSHGRERRRSWSSSLKRLLWWSRPSHT